MPSATQADLLDRAKELHQTALILLGHDHTMTVDDFRGDIRGGVTAKVVQAVVDARVYQPRAVYEPSLYSFDGFMREAMDVYDRLLRTASEHVSELLVVRTADDIRRAKASAHWPTGF